jgi:hypothetical protein
MIVYIVTLWREQTYEVVGIFSDEQKAIAACRTSNHGYGPMQLDKDSGDELIDWPEFRYPIREEAK